MPSTLDDQPGSKRKATPHQVAPGLVPGVDRNDDGGLWTGPDGAKVADSIAEFETGRLFKDPGHKTGDAYYARAHDSGPVGDAAAVAGAVPRAESRVVPPIGQNNMHHASRPGAIETNCLFSRSSDRIGLDIIPTG